MEGYRLCQTEVESNKEKVKIQNKERKMGKLIKTKGISRSCLLNFMNETAPGSMYYTGN